MSHVRYAAVILLVPVILAAGCVSYPVSPPAVTTPTTATTATPFPIQTTLALSVVPEPTDVMPPVYAVTVQVTRNTIATDPSITISFRGGAGLAFTQSMDATVIHPDGSTASDTVDRPQVGSEIVLPGTTRTDRVVVHVTIATGERYSVFDEAMTFQPVSP
jgi:hypothetical protein